MSTNYKNHIDQWLKGMSEETASKVWKVVVALNTKKELSNDPQYPVPYKAIQHDTIKNEGLDQGTMEQILFMIIQVLKKEGL